MLSRFFGFRAKQVLFKDWRIVRGDKVEVITGKDRGKQGTVLKVKRKFNTVVVSGVNFV
jgi:large subunit ribosomal protein L24